MRLWLLRHAKSSWDRPELKDHDRPLSPRGEAAAKRMRRYLDGEDVRPALVLCSSARRTLRTLELISPAIRGEPDIRIEPELYTFDATVLLSRLRAIGAGSESVMLVGHNPAIHELALDVAGSGEAIATLVAKYPTGALAEIEVAGDTWGVLEQGTGSLIRFVRPRDLP
jgi:phosphohistidine phosphatase